MRNQKLVKMDIIKNQKVKEIEVNNPQIVEPYRFDCFIKESFVENRGWLLKLFNKLKKSIPE